MEKMLCPSMMCANYGNLEKEIKELELAGIDSFHLDVMDGVFVSNIGMGLQDIEYICNNATKKKDIHLMMINPAQYVEKFAKLGADIIYIHPESDVHICKTLQTIKDLNVDAGIAINPGTSYEMVKECLPLCDYVLVMSVNPGYAGQKYLDFVEDKMKKICDMKNKYKYKVILDGACSFEKIKRTTRMGVDGFVLGTSAIFNQNKNYNETISEIRNL